MKKLVNVCIIIVLIAVIGLIAAWGYVYFKKETMEVKNPIVTMEVENYGTIKIELYPDKAPEAVANFVNLAQNGYYDGLTFHRVIDGFMIQAGGYKAIKSEITNEQGETVADVKTEAVSPKLSNLGIKDQEDREYCIKGEFYANGVKNDLKHEEGVISMARADYTASYDPSLTTESYNSAGAQFFIMTEANAYLDGNYAAFGKVIEGMDIVHKIEKVEVKEPEEENEEASEPTETIIISSIKVDTKGGKYKAPKTLEVWDYMSWLYKKYGLDLNSMSY